MSPRISVSITCYNHARFIRQCIDSVLAQTYPAIDIHVIDDCSTDGSLEMLKSYGDRIRLTARTKNHGVSGYTGTINQEIDTASGDFWYRLDSDDYIEPMYFESMVQAIRENPALDWVCGGLSVVNADGVITDQWDYTSWSTEPATALKRAWQTCSVPLPHNGIFRLDFLRKQKLHWNCFPYGWGADVLFTIRALQAGVNAKLIPGHLFNWRTHGNNTSCDVGRRVGLVIAVKEYFAEKIDPYLYLSLPSHGTYDEKDRQSLIRLMQAEDLLKAKRQFRIPGMFTGAQTSIEIHEQLHLFDHLIDKWIAEARVLSSRFQIETNRLEKSFRASQKWVEAEIALDTADYVSARTLAETALTIDSQFFEASRVMTDSAVALGSADAGTLVRTLVESAPSDARVLNTAGVFIAGKGEHEQAFSLFGKSIANGGSLESQLNFLETAPEISSRRFLQVEEKQTLIQSLSFLADGAGKSERTQIVNEQRQLRQNCLDSFAQKHAASAIRLLLHLPSNGALKYLFQSWADMLNHLGIQTRLLPWGVPFQSALTEFQPTVILSVADPAFVEQLDLSALQGYKRKSGLLVGWVTTLSHSYQPSDFYLTFHLDPARDPRFLNLDKPLISVPFAANPLKHLAYDLPMLWDYFFVGTNSRNKINETASYLAPILRNHRGILAGVGWNHGVGEVSVEEAALCYQAARIAPNFHMQGQLDQHNELNERCYIIPALGSFQIVDRAKALSTLFTEDEIVIADTPADYQRLFAYYLEHPEERVAIAQRGMRRVWAGYTLAHHLDRLGHFLTELPSMLARKSHSEIVSG
jgi:glycosyltransferase involved in cell wall biosynthesis/Tfp pilus assembly protein PilF